MNKISSIYATEVHENEHPQLKGTFQTFRSRLDANIRENIAFQKKTIARQSTECFQQLQKIKEQSNRHKKRIDEQEQEFEQKIERHIKHDISKWNDYQKYFRDGFETLEQSLELHRERNREHIKKISLKRVQLKALLQQEKESHCRISSLVKKAEERSGLTTKESSVLAHSHSLRNRIKTESSLPALKPSHRYDRIKTIQSEYEEQKGKGKRVMSYMEPIGTLRKKEESCFTLLIDILQWYKQRQEDNIGDNWFLKVLFSKRHFNKLIAFLEAHTSIRKVETKL